MACAKRLKGLSLRGGEFSRYKGQEVEPVAFGNCADCLGLIIPKLKLMKETTASLERDFDVVHLGTCVVNAKKTGQCPLDFDRVEVLVSENFNKKEVVGTHPY